MIGSLPRKASNELRVKGLCRHLQFSERNEQPDYSLSAAIIASRQPIAAFHRRLAGNSVAVSSKPAA
jgi:hypothetical protein